MGLPNKKLASLAPQTPVKNLLKQKRYMQVQICSSDTPKVAHNSLPVGMVPRVAEACSLGKGHDWGLIVKGSQGLKEARLLWNVGEAFHNAHCLLFDCQDLQ